MKSTESRATFLCALKYGLKGCALGLYVRGRTSVHSPEDN